MANIQYGGDMRKEFPVSPDYHITNHGSWGLSPKCVIEEKKRQVDLIEYCPDKFFRWMKDDQYKAVIDVAAKFVGADPNNLVIIGNATTGANCVVKSLKLKPGETILVNSLTYGAVVKACQSACSKVEGATCEILNVKFPIESEEAFVEMYETYLQKHPEVRLAVVDHITSGTALKLPVERLIEICRRHKVLIMVDGAHAPGQLPINIEELGADFYTGNLHKWCYVPRGCAVLWVHPDHQGWVVPVMTSHMYTQGLLAEFSNQATMDYSSYMCIPAGLKFYHDVGGYDKIHAYTSGLSSKAASELAQAWGTALLPVPESMMAPNMKCIRLPPLPYDRAEAGTVALMKLLCDKYRVICCVCPIEGEDQPYMRISAQIYNTMEDYEGLKQAILDIVKNSK